MDDKLLEKTRNKLKHDLSSEEQEALRKCSATIYTQTRVGAMIGGSLSVYGMYRRKLWPLSKYWGRGLFFGIGGIVVGMQLGLVSASMKCVGIVKALPNPDHVMKALREVQVELQDARRRPLGQPRAWSQKSEDDDDNNDTDDGATPSGEFGREGVSFGQDTMRQEDEKSRTVSDWEQSPYQRDEGSRNGQGSRGNESAGGVAALFNGPGPAPSVPDAQNRGGVGTQKEQSQNIWQQIRGENADRPETAWDRLRKTGNSAAPKRVETESPFKDSVTGPTEVEAKPSYNDEKLRARDKQQDDFDRLLERERKGEAEDAARKKNRFGDYN